jgi:hypothetical protein
MVSEFDDKTPYEKLLEKGKITVKDNNGQEYAFDIKVLSGYCGLNNANSITFHVHYMTMPVLGTTVYQLRGNKKYPEFEQWERAVELANTFQNPKKRDSNTELQIIEIIKEIGPNALRGNWRSIVGPRKRLSAQISN